METCGSKVGSVVVETYSNILVMVAEVTCSSMLDLEELET